jgi:hypothetical protein
VRWGSHTVLRSSQFSQFLLCHVPSFWRLCSRRPKRTRERSRATTSPDGPTWKTRNKGRETRAVRCGCSTSQNTHTGYCSVPVPLRGGLRRGGQLTSELVGMGAAVPVPRGGWSCRRGRPSRPTLACPRTARGSTAAPARRETASTRPRACRARSLSAHTRPRCPESRPTGARGAGSRRRRPRAARLEDGRLPVCVAITSSNSSNKVSRMDCNTRRVGRLIPARVGAEGALAVR